MLVIALQQNRLRFPFVGAVVLAPDERGRPVRVRAESLIIYERSSGAVLFQVRLERLRAFQISVGDLQREIRCRVPGDSPAVGIEARTIKIVTLFIRFASGENAAFDLHGLPLQAGGRNSESDVR